MNNSNSVTVKSIEESMIKIYENNYSYGPINTESHSVNEPIHPHKKREKETFFGDNIREASAVLKRIFNT